MEISILPAYAELALAFSILLIIISIYLMRSHRISTRLGVAWMFMGSAGFFLVLGFPTILSTLQLLLGTQFELSAAVFLAFTVGLALILFQQWKLSDSQSKIHHLASEVALLKYRIDASSTDPRTEQRPEK